MRIRVLCIYVNSLLLFGTCLAQSRSLPIEVPLMGSNGPIGKVVFRETMNGSLNVDVSVQALTRGLHAIHIHQNPECDAPDFKSAGNHYNPDSKQHGWRNSAGHHAGDFPENIVVDANGNGYLNVTLHDLSLAPGSNHSILGRSIVIHDKADDMRTQPSGGSGNRIACGVIPSVNAQVK